MSLILMKYPLRMETRSRNQIENELDHGPAPAGLVLALQDYKVRYTQAFFRPVLPSAKYNCHGLTFASRRTKIFAPQEVVKILKEDGYEDVKPENVLAGDIAVYYKDGDVEHSGIVVRVDPTTKLPYILGKWGFLGEAIHPVNVGPYAGNVKFYRMNS